MLTKHGLKSGICIFGFALVLSGDADGHLFVNRWGNVKNATASFNFISLSEQERNEIAEIAKARPSIDLGIAVLFDVDSAVLSRSSSAMPSVYALGKALGNPDLQGYTFVIAGCTDGLESESYSQALSLRRAEAVKYELVRSFNVPADRLITVGYGSSRLEDAMNPFNPVNNRVTVVNMGKVEH